MSAYPATTDPTAVVGRRFGAYVIDTIVVAALSVGAFFLTADVTLYERPATCRQVEAVPGEVSSSEECTDDFDLTWGDDEYSAATYKPAAIAIAGGLSLLYLILVQWILQAFTGMTLGKAIFGIRTVDEAGGSPGLGKQFIRGLLWIVDGLCNGLVALILILVTKGHRRLGDMAAKTFVVRSAAKGSPIVVPGMDSSGAAPAYAGAGAATAAAPVTPPAPQQATTPQQATAPQPAAAPQPAPDASGPQWDAQRNAYIQWDPAGGRWMTYDDNAAEWKPIEGDQPPAPSS